MHQTGNWSSEKRRGWEYSRVELGLRWRIFTLFQPQFFVYILFLFPFPSFDQVQHCEQNCYRTHIVLQKPASRASLAIRTTPAVKWRLQNTKSVSTQDCRKMGGGVEKHSVIIGTPPLLRIACRHGTETIFTASGNPNWILRLPGCIRRLGNVSRTLYTCTTTHVEGSVLANMCYRGEP